MPHPQGQPEDRRSPPQLDEAAPIRVLLVEDDPDFSWLLEAQLRATSVAFRVERAASLGALGARPGPWDVVLLDLFLPDSRGLDTLHRVQERWPDVAVVVCSALDDEVVAVRAVEQGAQDYLVKGQFGGPVLRRALRHAIRRKRRVVELERRTEAARHDATHDGLTGLPNRPALFGSLERAVAAAGRAGGRVAVLFLDCDRFKWINDNLGHAAGDELLALAAERIAASVRAQDTAARVGGDEFVVVLPDVDGERDAATVAANLIRALSRPFALVGGREVAVRVSVGIALCPEDASSPEDLLARADAAMYVAKRSGGGLYRFHSARAERADLGERDAEDDLRRALDRDELRLHYQPVLTAADERIVGAEALVRWQHRHHGLLPPERFLDVAERTGAVVSVGAWVLARACRRRARWRDIAPGLIVAVNVAAGQLARSGFADEVAEALRVAGLAPGELELEIAESDLLRQLPAALPLLAALDELGVRLVLDRFLGGRAIAGAVARLPIRAVKLDRSVVASIGAPSGAGSPARSAIETARRLGLELAATGVETRAQLDFLRRHGCTRVQGHLISHPLPARSFERLLR